MGAEDETIGTEKADCANSTTRRRFLRRLAGGGAVAATSALAYAWRVEPHWVEIVRRPLPIAGLPDQLVGKRLVQLSDLHVGPVVDQDFLLRSAASIAKLAPDAIVLTGDFMTCEGTEQVPRALEVVSRLPDAPLGRFAVLGNHDYASGRTRPDVADRLTGGLDKLGVRVLRNEMASVGDLQLVGVDDLWSPNFDPQRALRSYEPDRPAVALCHNPDGVDDPRWGSFNGWILAGHTHGGQCKAPWLDPPVLPVRNRRYTAGPFQLGNGRRLYVNRGLGYLWRVRFNCRPEVTLFELARDA